VTPADAEAGRVVIERVAAEHEREIEDDHFGVLIPYSPTGELPAVLLASLAKRRPELDPTTLVPRSWDELRGLIKQFVDVGTSKFVVLPMNEPEAIEDWTAHLNDAADALLPLET
jgi:hypothetical protein